MRGTGLQGAGGLLPGESLFSPPTALHTTEFEEDRFYHITLRLNFLKIFGIFEIGLFFLLNVQFLFL